MKVLRRGTPPGDTVHYCTCQDCRSVLQFTRKEATFVPDQRDGDCLTIKCPVCEKLNSVGIHGSQTNPMDRSHLSDYSCQ